MKKTYLLALIFTGFNSLAEEPKGLAKICNSISTVADKIIPFTSRPWYSVQMTPSGPVPGVYMALMQEDSVVLEFCKFYNQFSQLGLMEGSLLTADYGNKLTGKAFDDEIQLYKSTYYLGEATANLNKVSGSTLDKMSAYAPALNSYFGDVGDYSEKKGERLGVFTSRNRDESTMRSLLMNAREHSQLKEQSSCDDIEISKNPSYERDTSQKSKELSNYRSDVEFLFNQLGKMAVQISPSPTFYKEFMYDLNQIKNLSSQYNDSEKSFDMKSMEKKKVKKDGKDTVVEKEVTSKKNYQVFSVTKNDEYLDKFIRKYSSKWINYAEKLSVQSSENLFNNKISKVQQEYYDQSFDCRESYITEMVKEKHPDYFVSIDDPRADTALREFYQECVKESATIRKIKNLFSDYAQLLYESEYKRKVTQGELWTIDSYYNGTYRSIVNNESEVYGQKSIREEIACSQTKNFADLKSLQLKTMNLENSQRGLLLEEKTKLTMRKQAEFDRRKQEEENLRLNKEIEIEAIRRADGKKINFRQGYNPIEEK